MDFSVISPPPPPTTTMTMTSTYFSRDQTTFYEVLPSFLFSAEVKRASPPPSLSVSELAVEFWCDMAALVVAQSVCRAKVSRFAAHAWADP